MWGKTSKIVLENADNSPRTDDMAAKNNGRLLVLDDELSILEALKRIFQVRGWAVRTALNIEIANRLLEMYPFDVIIADYRLPSGNGLEFLNKARSNRPWVRGILITGYQNGLARSFHTIEGGIYPFIEKPWDEDELIQWVETLLQMSRNLRLRMKGDLPEK